MTLAFIVIQLFAYTSLCAGSYAANYSHTDTKMQAINNPLNGFINKSQTDSHFVCQNISAKSTTVRQKKSDSNFIFAYVIDFKLSERITLIKYIWDSSNYKSGNYHLVYSTEINRRAP